MKRILTGLSVALALSTVAIAVAPRASDSILCIICRAYTPDDLEWHFFMCATCPPEPER